MDRQCEVLYQFHIGLTCISGRILDFVHILSILLCGLCEELGQNMRKSMSCRVMWRCYRLVEFLFVDGSNLLCSFLVIFQSWVRARGGFWCVCFLSPPFFLLYVLFLLSICLSVLFPTISTRECVQIHIVIHIWSSPRSQVPPTNFIDILFLVTFFP